MSWCRLQAAWHPVLPLDAGARLEAREMTEFRLVAADLFGGDDEVGGERRMARSRRGEEIVVAVGQHGELPAGIAQRAEGSGHIRVERQVAPSTGEAIAVGSGEIEVDRLRRLPGLR